MAKSCINIEEEVDSLEESYRKNHMDRINRGFVIQIQELNS